MDRETGGDIRELPEPLDRLGQSLTEAVGLIQQTGGTDGERLLGLVRSALEALRTAAGVLTAAASSAVAPEVVRAWLHELRAPVTAITGWARLLGELSDGSKRARAAEAIERNAKLLMELLAHPPG